MKYVLLLVEAQHVLREMVYVSDLVEGPELAMRAEDLLREMEFVSGLVEGPPTLTNNPSLPPTLTNIPSLTADVGLSTKTY